MKILCVSDQIDPLIYNPNAKKNFPDVDLILCAGDLPMDYVDFIVSVLNKPTYFVFGNHDLSEYKYYTGHRNSNSLSTKHNHGAVHAGFKNLSNKNLNFTKKGKKTPLLISGADGSINYNNGTCQFSNRQMMMKLLLLVPGLLYNRLRYGRYLDIFLTHATPENIHDKPDPCHKGFKCFNWFIKTFKPQYMVHGHIHLYDQREERIGKYFDTTVVNSFSQITIELN